MVHTMESISQLFDLSLRSSEIAGAAAILVAIARLAWSLVGYLLRVASFYLSRRISRYEIELGPIENVPRAISGIYCQIVRFGTDLYIEKMASDQERYEGRLQNKVRKLATHRTADGRLVVQFRLPVHKRIGTQFKTFVRVHDAKDLPAVEAFLGQLKIVSNVKSSPYQDPPKVSFTINMFPIIETVEGIKNNFFYPV
jgi:hypothetical protein